MKYPEGQQKDENREVYIRRISKLPILHPKTILCAVFQIRNQDALRYIEDCARLVFPKAFPPTDRNGFPLINPENISTKAFANWVVEENIFEAWLNLGQKVSPFAELFIELALRKTGNPTKHSAKTKANQGRWAESNKQKKSVRQIAKKLWQQNKKRTIKYVIWHNDTNKAAPNKAESTLRSWIKDLAPSNKPGRPKKK